MHEHPSEIRIQDYDYELPDERIARYPLPERDASKLLVYDGSIKEDVYSNLPNHLPISSLLVFNDTKVVHARMIFKKPTGGKIEIFCLEPDGRYESVEVAMARKGEVYWKCLVGGVAKWKGNTPVSMEIQADGQLPLHVEARLAGRLEDAFLIQINWGFTDTENKLEPSQLPSFAEVLEIGGELPLPPYLKRTAEESDEIRYQTIFAKEEGSVAAPTAALHFTPELLAGLKAKQVDFSFLTLHVGAGTFKPVKSEKIKDHPMHAEWIDVSEELILSLIAAKSQGRPIVAVGTTSARTLESLYWIGLRLYDEQENTEEGDLQCLPQWFPYERAATLTPTAALEALLFHLRRKKTTHLLMRTQIIIAPGYPFQVIDGLITNFHQPQSTLLLLVAALVGKDWRSVYAYALNEGFRFLSYGDGSLLWKQKPHEPN